MYRFFNCVIRLFSLANCSDKFVQAGFMELCIVHESLFEVGILCREFKYSTPILTLSNQTSLRKMNNGYQ